mgnify:CR=1 FL=1
MHRKVFASKVYERKVVLVTGGCAGIGRALDAFLFREGRAFAALVAAGLAGAGRSGRGCRYGAAGHTAKAKQAFEPSKEATLWGSGCWCWFRG